MSGLPFHVLSFGLPVFPPFSNRRSIAFIKESPLIAASGIHEAFTKLQEVAKPCAIRSYEKLYIAKNCRLRKNVSPTVVFNKQQQFSMQLFLHIECIWWPQHGSQLLPNSYETGIASFMEGYPKLRAQGRIRHIPMGGFFSLKIFLVQQQGLVSNHNQSQVTKIG